MLIVQKNASIYSTFVKYMHVIRHTIPLNEAKPIGFAFSSLNSLLAVEAAGEVF